MWPLPHRRRALLTIIVFGVYTVGFRKAGQFLKRHRTQDGAPADPTAAPNMALAEDVKRHNPPGSQTAPGPDDDEDSDLKKALRQSQEEERVRKEEVRIVLCDPVSPSERHLLIDSLMDPF